MSIYHVLGLSLYVLPCWYDWGCRLFSVAGIITSLTDFLAAALHQTMFGLPGLLALHHCSPSMFWSQRASKCQAHAPFHSGSAEEERGRGDERVAQTFWSHSCRIGSKEMLLQLNGTHLAWNEVWHWAGCGNLGWERCCCVGSWSLIVRFPKTVPRLKQFCHEVSKEIWRKSWPPFWLKLLLFVFVTFHSGFTRSLFASSNSWVTLARSA